MDSIVLKLLRQIVWLFFLAVSMSKLCGQTWRRFSFKSLELGTEAKLHSIELILA